LDWGRVRRRLRFLLSHGERQRLLWEEMDFHIESMTEDSVARGMTEMEARAAARRKFGNMTQKSEESRGVWLARWWSDLAQDLRPGC
jgi:macrolide transport system ATP-binding/permease protein